MSSSNETIEFTDIVLKSPLPLNQYLVENPCLSLRLIVDGVTCGETPVVHGDHETGKWVMNVRFHRLRGSDSFKLVAIVNTDGLKIPLLAIDHQVAAMITRVKERPDEHHQISICEPMCPLQLDMICRVKLSSSLNGSSIGRERYPIDAAGERSTVSNAEGNNPTIPSREDLESQYLKTASLADLDTRAAVLSQLGRAYYAYYKETMQETDLRRAICIHEEAVQSTSAFHPKLAKHLQHAGDALQAQFKQNGEPAVIEKAISHYERALSVTDDGDPTKASHLFDLGTGLYLRFGRLGDPADIDRAITTCQKALEMTAEGYRIKRLLLDILGNSFLCRFESLGKLIDVDSAISVLQEAVKITPDGHPDKPCFLSNLGNSLFRRFERLGNLIDVDGAISAQQEAVKIIPDSHPDKPSFFNNLGSSLRSRFERLGNVTDVDGAISVQQEAVKITPDGHPKKPSFLSNLGSSLARRCERLENVNDLDDAISVLEEAVKISPDGHPDKPSFLSNLGNSLGSRFERFGNVADVDGAISVLQEAVKITPDGHPGKPSFLSNLGNSLNGRFERLGNVTDLDGAILFKQEAVEMTPDGHPDKPSFLSNLGGSLRGRFERFGNVTDLDGAILVQQEAVEMTPDGHPNKPSFLSNLGDSLLHRFERLGNVTDVDGAISVQQEAVKLTPDGHPDKPSRLSSLGSSLSRRFERLENLTDVDGAISVLQEAVKITPDDHPEKPLRLTNLGVSLVCRFERLGNVTDVDGAISVLQEAVKIIPDGHPNKPTFLNNLGNAFRRRFERLGNVTDVNVAISVQQEAVKITPDGHPEKPSFLNDLGNSLKRRFERLGNLNDLEDALQTYSRAVYSLVGPPMIRFNAAREWARTANQNSRSPLPAFRCSIGLLPRIAWLGLKETDQHALLADIGDIVREAVAAAVEHEEYETAIEWAEQGRSIVWQNLLNLRTPIDDLAAVNPALANRLKDIGRQLESPVPHNIEPGRLPVTPVEDVSQKYSKLATEWDEIVEEIRRIPTFEGFLSAKRFAQLAVAGSEGPVVVLNIHQSRSDALVLVSDESSSSKVSVVNIPLDPRVYRLSEFLFTSMSGLLSSAGVRSRSVHDHVSIQPHMSETEPSYQALEKLFDDVVVRLSPPGLRSPNRQSEQVQSSQDWKFEFSEILGLLWVGVVKPVLDGLDISAESDHHPRIWWCATGPLSFLPIHAAGIYGTGKKGDIISEYVVSSYTPTLNAILDQSQPIVQVDFQILTVAVAQPASSSALPIYGTEDEVKLVQYLAHTNGVQCINLTKENATMKRVVQEMMESHWIHLACHGQQNIKNSMESGFLLHDRILRLSEIVKLSLPKADFAFLSACQTATGDEKIAEESVHLAAGMLLSGCQGVIATMWSINDNDAPKVAEDVYRSILKDGRPNRQGAAYALHEAVKRLRDSGVDFLSWVPFIHIGL